MTHTARSRSHTADPLDGPVVGAHLGGRVGTLRAGLLLLVERAVAAATAEGVALGVALTEASSSFGLQ